MKRGVIWIREAYCPGCVRRFGRSKDKKVMLSAGFHKTNGEKADFRMSRLLGFEACLSWARRVRGL